MSTQIRVLHVLGNTRLGGAESRIMDLYRAMDRDRVQFDFLIHEEAGPTGKKRPSSDELMAHKHQEPYDDEIRSLGGQIYALPRPAYRPGGTGPGDYRKACRAFFEAHRDTWRVVQGHMTSTAAIYLDEAHRAGIPVTIAHARSAGTDPGLKGIITRLLRRPLSDERRPICRFACSREAARAVFGDAPVVLLPNAVPVRRFSWDPGTRQEIRREYGLEGCRVIGHVGWFRYAKNHEFLLRAFRRLRELQPEEQSRLLLVGTGERMEEMKKLAEELGIAEQVVFAGNRNDIHRIYQAMDVFAFPSRYEGLPGSVVEAQAAALPCLVSSRVTRDVGATELVTYLPIDDGRGNTMSQEAAWAEALAQTLTQETEELRAARAEQVLDDLIRAGLDTDAQARLLEEFYLSGQGLPAPERYGGAHEY